MGIRYVAMRPPWPAAFSLHLIPVASTCFLKPVIDQQGLITSYFPSSALLSQIECQTTLKATKYLQVAPVLLQCNSTQPRWCHRMHCDRREDVELCKFLRGVVFVPHGHIRADRFVNHTSNCLAYSPTTVRSGLLKYDMGGARIGAKCFPSKLLTSGGPQCDP